MTEYLFRLASDVGPVPVLPAPLEAGLQGGEEREVQRLGEVRGVGAEEEGLDGVLVAGLGHGQAGVAAGTVHEAHDGGGDVMLLYELAQGVDDVQECIRSLVQLVTPNTCLLLTAASTH